MEKGNSTSSIDNSKTIELLTKGVLDIYEPPLVTISTHLKELVSKQEDVHSMLTSETQRLENIQNDALLDSMLTNITINKEKLVSISNSMMTLHKRVQSLQARAAAVEKMAKSKSSQKQSS